MDKIAKIAIVDALIESGIGSRREGGYEFDGELMTAPEFMREWRVAGAILERLKECHFNANYGRTMYSVIGTMKGQGTELISSWPNATGESLPESICRIGALLLMKENPQGGATNAKADTA